MENIIITIKSHSGYLTWYIDKGERLYSIYLHEHLIKCVDTIGEALEYILIEKIDAKEVNVVKN